MKKNRVPFIHCDKNRNAARPGRSRILAGSIAAFAATLVSFSSVSRTQAATVVFDGDANGANGITDTATGSPFAVTFGTTSTFINPLVSSTSLITGASTDIFQFGANSPMQTLLAPATINVSTSTVAGLIFGATGGNGYSLSAASAQALTIGTSGIVVNAGAFATSVGSANLGLTLGAAQTWQNDSANTLTIGGAITNAAFLSTLRAQGAGDINVTGAFTGATNGGVTVDSTGSGRVILSGINTQTGTTTLTAGILRATTSASALGAGALQLNGGTLQLANDTALSFGRNTTVGGNTTILSDRLTAGAGVTQTLGTLSIGAFTLTNNVGAFVNATGTTGLAFGATTVSTTGAVINTNNSFFASGITNLTTLASLSRSTQALTIGGTGNTTITGGDTGTTGALTKSGTGTLTLGTAAGASTYASSGLITLNGGTINVTPSTTFTAGTKPGLTFGGTGGFTFNSTATAGAVTQNMGALTFSAGQGTVTSVFTTGVTSTALTFGSLAARTAGATGNFVTTGGANGTTNSTNLTGAALGFQNQGLFFNGSNYAYVNAAGTFVRAPVYGTDTNFSATIAGGATLGINDATKHLNTTAAITLQTAASVATLRIDRNSAANFTQTTGTTLTLANNGIIRTGGGATTFASSSTTAATLTGAGELVINTNAAADAITFSASNPVVITGFTGLTKTGAGTLAMANVANTFTGPININGGTLSIIGPGGVLDPTSLGAAGARVITLNGGTFQVTGALFNPNVSTKTFVIGPSGGTFDTSTGSLTLDDGTGVTAQLSGSGNLTKIGVGTLTLGNGNANSFAGFTGNLFINAGTLSFGTITAGSTNTLGDTTGSTVIASGATFNLNGVIAAATTNEPLIISGTGLASAPAGVITNSSTTGATFSGPITLAGDSTITPGSGGITLSGSIGDGGRGFVLTKNGGTFLTLNGANTYSGGTVIAGASSQLALGNSAALGTGSLTVANTATGSNIVASTAVVMTNGVILNSDTSFGLAGNGNISNMTFGALNLGAGVRSIAVPVSTMTTTFTGAVTNGTGLTMTGLGTLALSGTGSFTGAVTNNGGGTLSLGATTLNTAGSVSIGSTATSSLNFNADNIGKAANLAANTTVTLGGAASQALLGFQLGDTSNYDSLNLSGATGNVTVGAGGAVISISPLTGFTPAPSSTNTYNLITTSGGGTISNFGNITLPLAGLPTGYNYTFTTNSTAAVLGVTAGAAGNLFWRGDVNGSWNGGAGTADTNWNNAADAADALFTPNATNTVVFSSSGLAGPTSVTNTLDQNFSVAGITVNNTNTGVLTVNQGAFGTLTLGTGGITVNTGGPVSSTINAPIALGGAQTWTVTDVGQALSIQGAAPARGVVSGAFGVTLAGAGQVTLGGFNTFSGGLTTGAGQLNINNGGSTTTNSALGTGTVNFAGATTTLDNTSGVAQSVLTTGAQTWGGNVVFTGTNSLSLGTGGITLGANRNVTVNGGTLQLGGVIANQAFGITKLGTGALTLSGANLNTGGFVLSAGRVNVNSAAALGAAASTVALNGGTIDNTSGAAVVSTTAGAMTWGANVNFGGSAALTLPGAVTLAADRTITVNGPGQLGFNANALSLTGIIGGAFNVIKDGSGTLILDKANTFGGAAKSLTLNAGTLAANHATNNVFGGAGTTLIINGGALDAIIASAPAANYAQTWGGDFGFIGTNTLNLGTGAVALGAANRTVTTLASTLTVGGAISATGAFGITKNGAGQLTLAGASSYTGTTAINGGILQLNVGTTGAIGSLNSATGLNFTGTGSFILANILETSGSSSQSLAASSFTAGDGTIQINHTTAFNSTLTLASLNARSTGAVGLFAPGGSSAFVNGTSVKIAITTGQTANTIFAPGIFASVYTGANLPGTAAAPYTLAWYDTAGFVRSIVYGTDANTATVAGGATLGANTNKEVQTTAAITAQTTDTFNSLNINGAAGVNFTMSDNAQVLTLGATSGDQTGVLLRNGGSTTIIGATGAVPGSIGTGGITANGAGNELIIRADAAGDSIALNVPILSSTGSVTKSGAGTLILGGSAGTAVAGAVSNAFTGTLYINGGTVQVNSSSATNGNGATGALNSRPITINSGTLALKFDGDGTGSANSINSANAVTLNGNATITVDRLGAGSPISATPTTFTTPLNKTIQLGALNFSNAGDTLTVTPSNGYGLEFTGTTTLDKNLTTFNVGTATGSNVVQGLTLSGQVTGTIAGGSWTKAGVGTVVLNNATNNFVSNIVLSQGALAFNSDAALGNAANTVTLTGANVAVLRAFGGTVATPLSITTARTINFWGNTTANNVIEVTDNTTLTLSNAFGGGNSPFTKGDLGTLVLSADNGIWAGQLSIAAGAVRVTNAGALGISTSATAGNTVVPAVLGAALQLSGVSIFEQITLTGANDVRTTGINTGGALQAFSGVNTTNGLITLAGASNGNTVLAIGADSGATLNIRGGVTGAIPLTFAGAGAINVDTTSLGNVTSITKIGSGTTTLGVASPTFVGAITVNAGTLAFGGSVGAGAGSVGGAGTITINPGGTLSVDNTVGTGLNNRLSSGGTLRAITLTGANLNYIGHASVPSLESFGAANFANRGASTITVTAGASAGASLVLGAVSRDVNGGTALFRGSNLGSAPGAGVATIASTSGTGFTFTGAGAAGTITKGIVPWALVDASVSGTGTSFATADTATGNLRALASSEYVTSLGGLVSSANFVLGAADRLAGSSTINSLTLTSAGTATLNPLQTLAVGGGANLGGILNTAATTITGGLLTSGGAGGLVFHANADLSLDAVLIGSSGSANPYLAKTGTGILTLSKANAFTGQTVINQGTLKLAAGNNTLFFSSGNSYLAMNGGTLDLNGNSQQVQGLFSDGTVAGAGGTILGVAGSTLVTNNDNTSRPWAGVITGSVALQRGGVNTTTFYSDNTYSGATRISGGTIALQDAGKLSLSPTIGVDYGGALSIRNDLGTLNDNNRLKDDAAITLRGGVFLYLGRAATNSTERTGVLTIAAGVNHVDVRTGGTAVNSAEMTFTSLDHTNSTGIVNFAQANGTPNANGLIGNNARIFFDTPPTVPASGLIGPWAIVSRDFAAYNSTLGVAALNSAGYAGYSSTNLATAVSTDNVKIGASPAVLAADTTVNTLSITTGSSATIDLGTRTLTMQGRGLMLASNNTSNIAVSNGTLTSGTLNNGGDLFVHFLPYAGTGRTANISAVIADNGTLAGKEVRLIVSSSEGSGTAQAVTLNPTVSNTYTGGTVVNGGTVSLGGGVGIVAVPNAATPANGLILNGGSVTMVTNGGQIGSSNIVTLNGNSTLTLAGANSLAGLVFNVDGGAGTGSTVATGAGALTLTGGITAGGSNPNAFATISGAGGLNLNGATSYAMLVNGFSFNSQLVAPLTATLSITAAITNGGIVKTGDGLLSLGAANTFNSGVDLQAGGIAIANNGALGTTGSSTLTISGTGTTLTADATGGRTIANSVILANAATSINLGNYGAGTLTLSGATTWSTTTGVARTLNVNAVTGGGVTINTQTLSGVITSAGTGNGIVKTGIGTLAITGDNAATLDWTGANAVTVNNGLLLISADTALGAAPGAAEANNIVLNGGGLAYGAAYALNVNRGISLGATNGVIDTSTFNVAITGTVGGAGGLVKSGTGALTLSGASSFTGVVYANAGTLNFTNATAPTFTGLSVAGGAALNMLNGAGQAINLGSGALNLGAGTGAASLGLEMLNPTTNDSFTTTGAALTANTVILNMTRLSGATGGTFTLLSAASGLNSPTYVFNPAGWALTGTAVSATSVQVTATPVTGDLFWDGDVNLSWGGLNGSFDSNFSTDLAGTNAKSTPGFDQGLTFSSNAIAGTTLSTTLDVNSSIRDLTFSNNVGAGPLGTINIAPGVGGTLTITPAVSTAGINVQAGAPAAINISAPVTLGANQTWTVADAASVLNVSGNVTGTANLIKAGSGIVQMGGANSYVGTTTINAGILRAGAANGLNAVSAFTVGATGTLRLNGFNAAVGSLAGSAGAIVENFSGTAATLTAGADNTSTAYAGTIQNGTGAGTLGLTKVGNGVLTVSGTNTYTGLTTVDAGTLALSANTTTTTGQYLIANAANSRGILTISAGTSLTSTVGAGSAMRIGVGANSVGVVTQNGGSVTLGTVAQNYNLALGGDGGTTNSANTNYNFGAYNLNGGTAKSFQTEVGDSGGTGMLTITDGTFGDATGARHFILGRFGNSVGVVSLMGTGGATPTLLGAGSSLGISMGWNDASNNNRQELNIGNLGFVNASAALASNGLVWRSGGTNNVGIANLLTGGTLQTGYIGAVAGAPTSIFNFNGGKVVATQSSATFATTLTSAYVYSGGAIIDTNGFNDTVQALLAPTGNGVTLTGGSGSGYLAAPYVKITGDGVGATAIATIDGTGTITGFTLTNPGVGYTNATVTLVGGGGTGTAPTTGFAANTSGGLTKQGLGTLTLSGVNTFTGGTSVTGGTLLVNNSLASTTTTVANTATLGGTGTLAGLVTVNSGGTLSPATSTTGGTITLSSLTLDAGSLLAYEFGGTPDLVTVTTANGLTINGGALSLYAIGGVSPLTNNGTYDLFGYSTGFGGALTNLSVANSQAGKTYAINDTGTIIQLVLGTATSADWSGTIDGDWTLDGAGNNWNGGTQPNLLGAVANFGNIAVTPQTVTLNGGKTVGSILFNNTNSFTIGTTADVITLDNGIAASAISATLGNHIINAPIALNGPANITPGTGTKITFGGAISGTGKSLTFSGAGTSELNVANSYSGGTTLSAGTLNLGHDNALGTGQLTITGGTIDNTKGSLLSNTTNNNTQNWNGSFTFTGTDSMDLGTGAVTLGGTSTITTSGTAAKILTVGGAIDDGALSAGLTKAGPGTLVLNGNNGYDGLTTMSAGVLTLAGNNSGASGGVTLSAGLLNINSDNALGTGRLTLSGGTFDNTDAVAHTQAGNPAQTWTNAANVAFTGTKALNLGTGAVTLGTDATTGSFTLTNNSVLVGTSLTVGGNISAIAGGTAGVKTLTIAGPGSTALTGNITKGSASNVAVTVTSGGTTTLSGAASSIQTLNVNGGAASIVELGTGNLTITNGGTNGFRSSTGGTINATGGGSIILGSDLLDNGTADGTTLTVNAPITGPFTFEIYGGAANNTGVTVLTADNLFTGNVQINGGNLSVSEIGNTGSVTSNLGQGSLIQSGAAVLSGGNTVITGKLIYTGTGETTNRVLTMTGAGFAIEQKAISGHLVFSANVAVPNTGAKTLFLLGSAAGTAELAGLIPNNTAATSVTKLGIGEWTLSGLSATAASNYSGTTTIDNGTLVITHATTAALTGGLTFGATAANTTVGALDLTGANATFAGALTVQNNSASNNTITLGSAKTLSFTGAANIGGAAASTTKLVINGVAASGNLVTIGGGLNVDIAATGNNNASLTVNNSGLTVTGAVNIGTTSAAAGSTGTVTVSGGAATFNLGANAMNVGVRTTTVSTGAIATVGTLDLSSATSVAITGTAGSSILLGSNAVATGTADRSQGVLKLSTAGTNAVSATTITLGDSPTTGGVGTQGQIVLGNSTNTFQTDTLFVGRRKSQTGAAPAFASDLISFQGSGGTLTLGGLAGAKTTLNIGYNDASSTATTTTGVMDLTNGTFNGTLSIVTIGNVTGTNVSGGGVGTLTMGAGTVTADEIRLATVAGGAAGTTAGTLNLNGGTLTLVAAGLGINGGTAVTGAATVNLDGGILNMSGTNIGAAAPNPVTLNAKSGTLQNLSQLNGGGTLTKSTGGTLILSGTNAYTGVTDVTAGIVRVQSNTGLGSVSAGTSVTSGANLQFESVTIGAEALTLNGTGTTSQGALSGTGTSFASGTVLLDTNSSIGVAAGGDQLTLSGVISGTGASTLTKVGSGTLVLNGAAANTFTGATDINGGTLEAGAAGALGGTTALAVNGGGTLLLSGTGNRINDGATFTLAGGTFNTGGLSETVGTLTLTDDSIIDFGAGASTLTFANSTGLWTAGKTLSIWNWSGTPVSGGGVDQLRFTGNGLLGSQLEQISFYSNAGVTKLSITPQFSANGFVGGSGEVTPVPEPSSVATVMGLLGLIGWRERRKARAVRAAERRAIG